MLRKIYFHSAIGILFTIILIGCNSSDSGTNTSYTSTPVTNTPGSNSVVLSGMSFSPGTITITVGTTVKWTNNDNMTHTVTSGTPGSPSGLFDSGNLGNGGTFSYKFNTAGTFSYYCKLHPGMTGSVTVQ